MKGIVIFALGMLTLTAFAADKKKVRYKQQKKVNFEALLIEGQMKRPDVAIVTGNVSDGTDGLLRLREDFVDQIAVEAGESIR